MPWESDTVRNRAIQIEEEITAIADASNSLRAALMGRTFEYGVRLATLHAVSRSSRYGAVTMEDLLWGMSWSIQSTSYMIAGVAAYMSESENQAIAKAVKRTIEEHGGIDVPAWKVKRSLAHRYKKRDLEDVITGLAETGEILITAIASTKTGGRPGQKYTLLDGGG